MCVLYVALYSVSRFYPSLEMSPTQHLPLLRIIIFLFYSQFSFAIYLSSSHDWPKFTLSRFLSSFTSNTSINIYTSIYLYTLSLYFDPLFVFLLNDLSPYYYTCMTFSSFYIYSFDLKLVCICISNPLCQHSHIFYTIFYINVASCILLGKIMWLIFS